MQLLSYLLLWWFQDKYEIRAGMHTPKASYKDNALCIEKTHLILWLNNSVSIISLGMEEIDARFIKIDFDDIE